MDGQTISGPSKRVCISSRLQTISVQQARTAKKIIQYSMSEEMIETNSYWKVPILSAAVLLYTFMLLAEQHQRKEARPQIVTHI